MSVFDFFPQDYVRCGIASASSTDLVLTGNNYFY